MLHAISLPPDEPPMGGGLKAGGWYHATEDGARILCDLCPRGCSLGEGDRGFCFVRQNRGGRMVSTTYGRSTGFCIDPIEKKPLNHFYPGTSVLSFGTAGCNLGCKFCQNWSITKSKEVESLSEEAFPETIARAAQRLGCRSVAFTYNDPIVWAEYAIDTAQACRAAGVATVAVTSGYITPAAREPFFSVMDAANVDLKGFTEEFYSTLASGHLNPVLETIRWLVRETDVWVELTNLVIPGANDSRDEFQRMCQWILEELGPDVPVHFTAFRPDFRLRDRPPTPLETLLLAYETAVSAGLRYVYTGNISDRRHQATYCPGCGLAVVERNGYDLGAYQVGPGGCRRCGTPIAGRFDPQPGTWGSRRQPVQIGSFAQGETRLTSRREDTMEPTPPSRDAAATEPTTARPVLTGEQEKRVFQAACRRVAAAVRGESAGSLAELLGEVAGLPLYGAFVSLKRQGQLRSCCGAMAASMTLCQAVERSAQRAACDDPRFPPISPSELPHLDVEVWLLWNLQPMAARGPQRVEAVEIGRHGLQVAQGPHRGLLLPGVAVEHGFDARQFLEQTCLKAGLRRDAWLSDATQVMTFEGYAIHGPMEAPPVSEPAAVRGPSPGDVVRLAQFAAGNVRALACGATPHFYAGGYDGGVQGMALVIRLAGRPNRLELSQISLQAELPLQATLFSLCEAAGRALREQGFSEANLPEVQTELTVLVDPALHGPASDVDLRGLDTQRRAVLAGDGETSVWAFDPGKSPEELVEGALRAGEFRQRQRVSVASAVAITTETALLLVNRPPQPASPEVRPASVAGMFYPADPRQIERMLDDLIPSERSPEPWAACLVPHAGWVYSGRLAARVFSRVTIPSQVIVLCPKHRPGGAPWAVAPHRIWGLPGGQMACDAALASLLAKSIQGLQLDGVPHRQEHAIEVQLPILRRLAPQARVVGITVGEGDLPSLLQFGRELAEVLRPLPERPLLVISSDMNHFASDEATRRIDRHALDALASLDPERLYATVTAERISMCGMMPAVIVMEALRTLGLLRRTELVGYSTSAEASGDTGRVVGYAGVLFG